MEFKTAIVDECGTIMYWCSELTENKIDSILDSHPEWTIKCFEI